MRLVPLLLLSISGCSGSETGSSTPPPRTIAAPTLPQVLDLGAGEISLVTVKDTDTEVPAKFERVSGSFRFQDGLHQQGLTGRLEVDVTSWGTGLEERDGNVRNTFFLVDEFPTAQFTLDGFDGVPPTGVGIGEEVDGTATGVLMFTGIETPLSARLKLRRSSETDYRVDSAEPLYLSIETLRLKERLLELMTKCDHESVDDRVRVTFSFGLSVSADATTHEAAATVQPTTSGKTATQPSPQGQQAGQQPGDGRRSGTGGGHTTDRSKTIERK